MPTPPIPKRFTYWTADGKRHWTPRLNITLSDAESALLDQQGTYDVCRNRKELQLPKTKRQSAAVEVKAQCRQDSASRSRHT